MADLSRHEHLQPSLLDRLIDLDPANQAESRERWVLSTHRLKAAVLRDLTWLLNTSRLETTEDLEDYPHVRNSVLNYGVEDLAGLAVAGLDPARLEKAVREAIVKFEPRIDRHTIKVTAIVSPELMSRNAVAFRIEGELWAHPIPQSVLLTTEVDFETGDAAVSES